MVLIEIEMALKDEKEANGKKRSSPEEVPRKMKKDPNAPKKPMTAFMLFSHSPHVA